MMHGKKQSRAARRRIAALDGAAAAKPGADGPHEGTRRLSRAIENGALGKLTEFAILIVARQWTQQYLCVFREPAAIRAGLSKSIIAALAENRMLEGMSDDEQILYDFCTELH